MASHEIYNLLIYVFVHTNDSFPVAKNFLDIYPLILMRQAKHGRSEGNSDNIHYQTDDNAMENYAMKVEVDV